MTETLGCGYSYESTLRGLSNEYQHDRVSMIFKNLCVLVLWMIVASALEGLRWLVGLICEYTVILRFLHNYVKAYTLFFIIREIVRIEKNGRPSFKEVPIKACTYAGNVFDSSLHFLTFATFSTIHPKEIVKKLVQSKKNRISPLYWAFLYICEMYCSN